MSELDQLREHIRGLGLDSEATASLLRSTEYMTAEQVHAYLLRFRNVLTTLENLLSELGDPRG